MKYRQIAATTAFALCATAAVAQYTGPGKVQPRTLPVLGTVADVLRNPVDDQPVRLEGTLVRQTGQETFTFRDATGEIQVEIERDEFPNNQPVGPETRVTILGEVETRLMREPEIDTERLLVSADATPASTP